MLYAEALPSSGSGSYRWFESVFPYQTELNRVIQGLSHGFDPSTVLEWFRREVTTFLTERAVGSTALTIQPPTRYSIELMSPKPAVVELHLSEYGDLAGDFLAYDQATIPEIGLGLDRAFETMTKLPPGEGVVIFSPAINYAEFGSSSDVINIFIIDQHDGNVTKVTSHFLFLNQELSQQERAYWLSLHQHNSNPSAADSREILTHPQPLKTNPDQSSLSPQDYIDWMNLAFIERFGKSLFAKTHDKAMAGHIDLKVADNLSNLFNILLHQGAHSLYLALWKLIEGGQKQWATTNNINPHIYWQEILLGMRQLSLGFHPTDGSDLSQYWDPITNDWIGGTKQTCGEQAASSGHCSIHGDYQGEHCPKCKAKSND